MKPTVKLLLLAGTAVLWSATALAKLPAPSDEAKAKAAEAAAKTAWAGKVDGYLLCKAQDRVAAHAAKTAKAAGKETKPAPALPPCADPGPYVSAAAPAAAAASAPAPAAAVAAPAKKS
jgi:hypothetical protein